MMRLIVLGAIIYLIVKADDKPTLGAGKPGRISLDDVE